MQSLSAKTLHGGASLRAEPAGLGFETGAIGGIAQDRMADMGQMHPNLVGAAGLEGTSEQARDRLAVRACEPFQHLPMGHRRAAAFAHRPFVSGSGVTVERGVDGALGPAGRAPDEGEIAALDAAIGL